MLASCEFKNQVTGEVAIPSRWKKETTVQNAETQTSTLQVVSVETQTDMSSMQASDQLDKGVGTESKTYQASLDGLQYVYADVLYDEAKLADFLTGSKEALLAILHKNAKSSIFDNYWPNWSRKNTELTVLYTLTSATVKENGLEALNMAWNANGSMLAIAYGRADTSGWCYNKGYVCIWNLSRPDLEEGKPHYTLETETYATTLAFHPTTASMLAVGTYSGEVVVFPNVTDNMPKEYSSGEAEVVHTEPVTVLQWVRNPQELRHDHRFVLCSASQSGLILHWSTTNALARPLAAYSVQSRRRLSVGITALAYAGVQTDRTTQLPTLDDVLLVGLENGEVGRGRTGLVPVDVNPTGPCTVVPVELDWLEPHRGPVQSLCTSPFFRHLLLTCSSDGSARLYTDLERSPLLTLEPSAETKSYLYGAALSPFRPAVAAMVSREALLHVYDLQRDQMRPAYTAEAGIDGAAVLSIAFNPTAADWLATGDAQGSVKVWQLPTELSQTTEAERAALRAAQPSRDEKQEDDKGIAMFDLFGFVV
jgi:WD repeat-containing protein 34